jgi:hypothetical protein
MTWVLPLDSANMHSILNGKTPSSGRGQRKLALPVKCPSAQPATGVASTIRGKGAAEEMVHENIAFNRPLSIP